MVGKIYNNPRRFAEILEEVLDELRNDKDLEDEIRKRKAVFIDDIFRASKLAQVYDSRFRTELKDHNEYFNKLYELDLDALEGYLRAISDRNTAYMRAKVFEANGGDNFWNLYDNNFGIK